MYFFGGVVQKIVEENTEATQKRVSTPYSFLELGPFGGDGPFHKKREVTLACLMELHPIFREPSRLFTMSWNLDSPLVQRA